MPPFSRKWQPPGKKIKFLNMLSYILDPKKETENWKPQKGKGKKKKSNLECT